MKQRIYKTARELGWVLREPERVYICPKFLDDFAEELRKRAAAAPTKEKAAPKGGRKGMK
jgi:hypothetical protein